MKNVYFLLAIRLVCSLKLLVPIEFSYSSSLWTTVINTKTSSQNLEIYVIVNPNATPVTSLDANYQTLMISLNAAGIKILGNIDTVQCANSQTELQTQVDNWISYYGTYLYGFYFNNLQSQSSCIPLASSLASYAHNKGKKAFGKQSVFNYTEFNGVLDVIVYEGQTYPTIPAKSSTTSRLLTGVVIHSQALDTTSINSICTIADFIFISDESGPSPYSTLGSQFSSVASSVNSLYFNPSDDLCYATNCPSEFTADNGN